MDHLIAGQRDPKVLAQLARTRARAKITELQHALEGAEFFTAHHARLLKTMLGRIDQIDAQISELTAVIEELLAPYEEQLQQAESMPGWGRRSAEDAVAETGVDMTRFATGGHLVSWAGRAPLDKQSGKRYGPFETLVDVVADINTQAETDFEPGETLEEAEAEIGITDWVDPDTGEPAPEWATRTEDH